MIRLVLAECSWARKRRSVRVLYLVSLIGVVIVTVQALRGAIIAPSSMFADVASGIGTGAVMLAFVFFAALAGSDIQSGAFATLATYDHRRAVLVVGKCLVYGAVAGIAVLVTLASTGIMMVVAGHFQGRALPASTWYVQSAGDVGRVVLACFLAASLAVAGVLTVRSAPAVIAGFLGLLFAGDRVLLTVFPGIGPLLFSDNILGLANAHPEYFSERMTLLGAGVAGVVATLLVVGMAVLITQRRELR